MNHPKTITQSEFGELYVEHMPLVYGLCLKYLGSVDDARDAVMQIFEELAPKIERYEIQNLRTWLWSVARNHCLQKIRSEQRTVRLENTERIMETAPVVHLFSGENKNETVLIALEGCVEKLPEAQRTSVRMFFMEQKSYADIAETIAGGVKNVKSYIQNGKRNLKLCLERQGIML